MEKIIYASGMLLHFRHIAVSNSTFTKVLHYVLFIHHFLVVIKFDLAYHILFFPSGVFPDASSLFTNCFEVPQMFLKVLLLSLLMVFLFVCFLNLFLSYLPAPQMAPWLILNLLPPTLPPPFSEFHSLSLFLPSQLWHVCIYEAPSQVSCQVS